MPASSTLAARPHVLVARLDNAGDVLLAGPAVRAVAADARRLTFLAGPAGEAAARLLPGVDEVVTFEAPWVVFDPAPVRPKMVLGLVQRVADLGADGAVILTSFHQSPLPLALLLRLAGVPRIGAISVDYPGSLLDVRHVVDEDGHEVERALSLVEALGHRLPPGDDGRLHVALDGSSAPAPGVGGAATVVVHPGASVPARAWAPARHAALVQALADTGRRVLVTGGAAERDLTAQVAGPTRPEVTDLGGETSLAGLAAVLAGAAVAVTGNTGPAHLAAAVGTPVVSLFAPTVPASRWHPWGVPFELLGAQTIACAGCRARVCPVPGHPCLSSVTVDEVLAAVERLARVPLAVGSRAAGGVAP